MDSEPCNLALKNALTALKPGVRLPENVFAGSWSNFLFLESDALFVGRFVWAIKEFLRIEGAAAACLVNLTRHARSSDEHAALCLDNGITNDSYQEALRAERGDMAWLYHMEDYVCGSNVGGWCMYAEKENDLAVIALKNIAASTQFHYALGYLGADSLTYLLRARFPFTHLTAEWRAALIRNYRPSKGRNPQ